MNRKLFLSSSKSAAVQVTELFDFVWPTAAAMWNLRWQVDGYLRAHSTATDEQLLSRFVSGSDIRGANLRKACIANSWSSQQELFAKFILFELCSLYEGWADSAIEELSATPLRNRDFQFPDSGGGIPNAISALPHSSAMINSIYPSLRTNRRNSAGSLDSLLWCYRYFKECRNCIIHSNSIASTNAVAAFGRLAGMSAVTLGLTEVPEHNPLTLGHRIRLKLRGVVGFGEVVLRLMTTFDAELAKTDYGERLLVERWKRKYGRRSLSSTSKPRREQQIRKLISHLDLPEPFAISDLDGFLTRRRLAY
jgi:hypothetical protein